MPLRIGTRGSRLALVQADMVRRALAEAHPDLVAHTSTDAKGQSDFGEIIVLRTTGDRITDQPLTEIGGKGLFTKELDEALLDGRIDVGVHSMKDVPTYLPQGLSLAAFLPREDARDVFISADGATLDDLPPGALVGTASLRRQAQILALRPDLRVTILRGNVQTRLRKLHDGEVDATLLAIAGLKRLGALAASWQVLEPQIMLPAVAQGVIGLTCRTEDEKTAALCAALDCPASRASTLAEREMLRVLEGNCHTPIAGHAVHTGGDLRLTGLVASPEGRDIRKEVALGQPGQAVALGHRLGQSLAQIR